VRRVEGEQQEERLVLVPLDEAHPSRPKASVR
jgi:hypothetical protein